MPLQKKISRKATDKLGTKKKSSGMLLSNFFNPKSDALDIGSVDVESKGSGGLFSILSIRKKNEV